MRFTMMFLVAFLVASPLSAMEYLRHEQFVFVPDGREVLTALPLDPSRKYHVMISSPYTLRPLLQCKERQAFLFRMAPMCWPSIFINGNTVEYSIATHDNKLGLYFFDTRTEDYYRPRLDLYLWGTGSYLRLQATQDFTYAVPTTTVEVFDVVERESEILLQTQREQELARINEERLVHERDRERAMALQQAERELEMKQEHERLAKQARIDKAKAILKLFAGFAMIPMIIGIVIFTATADRRRHARMAKKRQERRARIHAEYQAKSRQEQETLAKDEARLRSEKQRLRVEAEKLEQEAEKERLAQQRRLQNFTNRMIKLELEFENSPHMEAQTWIAGYVEKYGSILRQSRVEIMSEHTKFHHDRDFIVFLQERAPHLYRRACWRMYALSLAEELDVTAPHQPLSPEERRRRTEQFRERALERERVKIDDETAKVFLAYESSQALLDAREAKIAEITARSDLSEDEKQERIRAIVAITEKRLDAFFEEERDESSQTSAPAPVVLGRQ